MKQFYLIIGNRNSGKTTYSQRFDNVLHEDTSIYRNPAKCIKWDKYNEYVLEGVYYSKELRQKILSSIPDDVKKIVIYLKVPIDILVERENSFRKRPIEIINQINDMFEIPTYDEGWDEIITINNF